MTSRSPSVSPSNTRSLGIASLLVLLGATVLPVPGCTDEPTPQKPGTNCNAEDLVNTDTQDCQQPVCQNGTIVNAADDTEVPDDGNECTTDTCSDGVAKHAPAMGACTVAGTAGTCVDGSCAVTCATDKDCTDGSSCTTDTCDTAKLTCVFKDDPANYDDKNECTTDSCAGGVEKHDNKPVNTACGASGNGKCDGNGVCKGCGSDADCPADEMCVDHYCDVATTLCQSMPKPDGDLPDDAPGDCMVSACAGGIVVMNINDADVPNDNNECTVDACMEGTSSNNPAAPETMCATGVCDGVSACVECVTAANCMGDSSCATNMCFSCQDNTKNGTESDIDCGSDCSTKCADGASCAVDTDCFYGTCDNMACVSCFDGTMNSTESDIDCGAVCGSTGLCGVNKKCNIGADCSTGVCDGVTKVCSAPKCTDMVKNGTETDVDCGGACPKCVAGKMCKIDNDCGGGTKCMAGICQ